MQTGKLCTLILGLCLLTGCVSAATSAAPTATAIPPTSTAETSLANPASVFCEAQGGQTDIRTESGGEVGYCVFPGNGECEEWAFFRGECSVDVSECRNVANDLTPRLGVTMSVTDPAPFQDPISGQNLEGCQAAVTGTGVDFESVETAVTTIGAMFQAWGWQADSRYDASGPNGAFGGYRQNNAVCLWVVKWEPSADAQCPSDQPISACELAPEQKLFTVAVNCIQE